MRKDTQHVVRHPEGWIKKSGALKTTKIFDTQSEAFDFGREVAINQETELFLHGRNGQIEKETLMAMILSLPKVKKLLVTIYKTEAALRDGLRL